MATSRPFAYNPSRTPIPGTEQVGDLAIGVDQQYYSEGLGGVRWWMGPDEDPGYIICYPFSAGTKPSPDGNIAYLGFKRSQSKTEESFVAMSNAFADGQATFSNGLEAYLWLNLNGNWTSYIPVTPTPTPSTGPLVSPTSTPTSTPTPTITPTNTNTPTNTETPTNTPTVTPTPNIVTTGLVMQLDANNILSYSGGTTVYDLTGSYNNSLLNGASFTTLNGIKCFDCSTGNNLIQVDGTGPSLPTSGYTYVGWSRIIASSATWRTLFRTNNNIPILTESGTDNLGYYNFTFQDSGYDVTSIQEVWVQYAVVGDNVSSDFYINGSLVGNVAYGAGGDTHVMWGNNLLGGQPFGYVANLYFYDRKLSFPEINQMYNFLSPNFVEITPTPTSTITPTTSNTNTPTISPTNTPSPTTSPIPTTGYSFNLVALPYNFPTSGNSIMNGPGGATSGTTEINQLATTGRGFYFNSIDTDGIDRTNYYSAFTGQSVTITLSQTGSTAVYSGDTLSFKQWIQSPMGSGFVFGTNIGVPPSGTPSGTAVLIQSASTPWNFGIPVYVSLTINTPVTPTPTSTPTNTITPTTTSTNTPTTTSTPTNTPSPTSTGTTASVFQMTLFESGSDVIMSGTGTFNTTSLGFNSSTSFSSFVRPNLANFNCGHGNSPVACDTYTGITSNPSNFGSGVTTTANSGSGDTVGFISLGPAGLGLIVPTGYVSNTTLTTQSTYTGKTLSSMGCAVGTYTWSWGSGVNAGTLILNIV